MIKLLITEFRNTDPAKFFRNRVRIFLNGDFSYGLWVDEDRLFDLLSTSQKREYLVTNRSQELSLQVTREVALKVAGISHTPYASNKKAILESLNNNP